VDLGRQIAIVRAWFPLLVACTLLAAGVALGVSSVLPKAYEARATLIVGQSLSAINPDYNQLLVSQRLSTTYATLATTRPILNAVIEQFDLGVAPEEFLKVVRASAAADSALLTISVQDGDPRRAADIANALAEQLIAASPAIQGREAEFQASIDADLKATQAQIQNTQAQIDGLRGLPNRTAAQDAEIQTYEGRLVSLRATYATLLSFSSGSAANLLQVIEPAAAPLQAESPRPLLNTVLAAFLGLLIACGIAFVAEYLNDTVKDAEAVRDVAGLSTLGTIAKMRGDKRRSENYRLATLLYPRSSDAEAYRTLRANIEFAALDKPVRTLLVTSSLAGEGKTVTASNVAVAFAQTGRRVLLVDADLRMPGLHIMFDLPNGDGLTTLLRSDDRSVEALASETEQANLRILTTGPLPPNPAELLASERMRVVVQRLEAAADLVVFDGAPLNAVADSITLSSLLDGTLMVIDAGRSSRRAVKLGRDALTRAGANVLGAVLNRVPRREESASGYYGAYDEAHAEGGPVR
jgi:polysaccharide biosynthesis transport protein